MDYPEWQIFYKEILMDFGFSKAADIESAIILNDLVEPLSLKFIEEKLANKKVLVYGSGNTLENVKNFPNSVKISANGATSYLLKMGIVPDLIVTDLDGRMKDLYKANKLGSIMVIHAHGDNIDKIKTCINKFKNIIPTCQCKPIGNLQNFGGFTDGDRAVFLAAHFNPINIILYGMDFKGVGKYSFSKDTPVKRKKIQWGKKLLNYLEKKGEVKISVG